MKKQDDNELDYNIVFNDEIIDDDIVDEESDNAEDDDSQEICENVVSSNNGTTTVDNFYSNYFNHKTAHCDCENENCGECADNGDEDTKDDCCHTHNHNESCMCGADDHTSEENSYTNEEEYNRVREENLKQKLSKYKEFEFDDETDFTCELDPNKICDNCGMCLDSINTDKDGYAEIKIDKIDKSGTSLDELYKMYGLDDD